MGRRGANRITLHVAGGALVAGLGGGSIGSAAAGAAGAGFASAFAGKLNGLADQIGDATGSLTLGNVAANVLAGAGGALVGGSAGAFTASNTDLYNRSTGNGDGTGGTGSEFLDRVGDALVSTATDPLGALNHALNSLIPSPSGQNPPADPNPLVQANDGGNHPSGTAGAVVTPPAMLCTPNAGCVTTPAVATPGTPGYGPSNATLNSGSNDGATGNSGNDSAYDRVYGGRTSVENVTSRGTSIETVSNSNDATAASDFAALKPNNVKTVSTGRGDVSIGTLDDGSTVILRPSKDGRTTIEFQNTNGRTTKEIRYGSK